ncbi:Carbohydrate-binding protein [Tolypocladium paradoxum]|uniref:Carbohydrate-binding protein n=1 Tax=Tolypocladium paradoxum TaxID=94208 RepID=A0A2S4KZ66_9HYPO|nr:Carbohydrate-binding protein [Tolypocladium paradoxum]
MRGTDNGVYQKTRNNSIWEPSILGWTSLGGTAIDDIVPVSTAPNHLDLFFQGTDNAVYQKSWNGSAWVPSAMEWTRLGGVIMSRPSAVAWDDKRITLAAQFQDNDVQMEWDGSTWKDCSRLAEFYEIGE